MTLTPDQSKVLRAVPGQGQLADQVATIADRLRLDPLDVGLVLNQLVACGFVHRSAGGRGRYCHRTPEGDAALRGAQ